MTFLILIAILLVISIFFIIKHIFRLIDEQSKFKDKQKEIERFINVKIDKIEAESEIKLLENSTILDFVDKFDNSIITDQIKNEKIEKLKPYPIEYFYHITHKDNLQNILQNGLYSHNLAFSNGLNPNLSFFYVI